MSDENQFKMPEPGPQHELLRPFEGTFNAEVKIWMGPGEPALSTGRMTNTFQVGGLFLHQEYQGDKVDGPFPSFVGRGYWGYNTNLGNFEGFWIDNASTQMQMETGTVDESGKTWEMSSEFEMHGATMKKRTIIKILDNDHHTMESFMTQPGGEEMKSMEIDYKRVK